MMKCLTTKVSVIHLQNLWASYKIWTSNLLPRSFLRYPPPPGETTLGTMLQP